MRKLATSAAGSVGQNSAGGGGSETVGGSSESIHFSMIWPILKFMLGSIPFRRSTELIGFSVCSGLGRLIENKLLLPARSPAKDALAIAPDVAESSAQEVKLNVVAISKRAGAMPQEKYFLVISFL